MNRRSKIVRTVIVLAVVGIYTPALAQFELTNRALSLVRTPVLILPGEYSALLSPPPEMNPAEMYPPEMYRAKMYPADMHPEAMIGEDDSTVQSKPKMRLLPDHLSPMESVLWGESGLLRKTGIAPLTPGARKSELGFRRTLLTLHQIGGFATVGLMIPTLILGQRNISNWSNSSAGRAPLDRQLDRAHKQWAGITFAAYMTTASFAIFSPPPLIRRDEATNTITIHKTLAWIHFAGMVALPVLGMLAGSKTRSVSSANDFRTAHQITGYVTAAALTASMIIITF